MSKPTLQKVYEKMTMIQQNTGKLCLLAVLDEGEPAIALGLKDGESITPVAIMLDQSRINKLNPDWDLFDVIQPIIEAAQKLEDRVSIKQFDGQHLAIDKHFDEANF